MDRHDKDQTAATTPRELPLQRQGTPASVDPDPLEGRVGDLVRHAVGEPAGRVQQQVHPEDAVENYDAVPAELDADVADEHADVVELERSLVIGRDPQSSPPYRGTQGTSG